jgi:hypothetical protein
MMQFYFLIVVYYIQKALLRPAFRASIGSWLVLEFFPAPDTRQAYYIIHHPLPPLLANLLNSRAETARKLRLVLSITD